VRIIEKLYGVIGDPIAHSLSPVMHNEEFKYMNLNYYYQAFHVKRESLKAALHAMKASKIAGFNVTIPHKEDIIPLLDEIDSEAEEIGAVNTVVCEEGKLVGYNTDGRGFLHALHKLSSNWQHKRILLIGAGGAARAIFITLLNADASQIDITNRNLNRANELIMSAKTGATKVLSITDAEESLHEYDIIINTTPVGMDPNTDEIPIELTNLNANTILCDIIYTPFLTKWLQIGKEKGAIISNGLPMFVMQGALAFHHWTGLTPNIDRMEQTVKKALKEGIRC
jgi:shikimate dehydrogenase